MNIIVEIIAEHLLSNRRLVVPGFGAFMVKDTGERVFADLLRTDDGVLISLLEAKGMSMMEAAIVVDRFIFEVRYELEQYGYCRLGEIGTLRIPASVLDAITSNQRSCRLTFSFFKSSNSDILQPEYISIKITLK